MEGRVLAVRAAIVLLAVETVVAFATYGRWPGAIVSALLGVLWLAGAERGDERVAPACLVGAVTVAVVGLWWSWPAWWMAIITTTALVAWDLQRFAARLGRIGRVDDAAALQAAHLRRLLLVTGISLVATGIALEVELRLTLARALVLGALAAVLLRRIMRESL